MPVLIITPNGSIYEKATINAAFVHDTQPNPLLVNLRAGMVLVVTTDQVLQQNIVIPAGVELRITNNAVITVPTGLSLTIQGEFQKPHYACFILQGTGTVIYPEAGPGPLQNWSIKDLICAGLSSFAGAMSGLSAIFTGNVQAARFIGPVTGAVTGNADTATNATNAQNAIGGGTIPEAPPNYRFRSGKVSGTPANVTFSPAFGGVPEVIAVPNGVTVGSAEISNVTASGFTLTTSLGTSAANASAHWIAIGRR